MKNVYLTGSTGGIGSAVASLLEKNGFHIVPVTSRLEDTQALVSEIQTLRKRVLPDVLIHCAGFGRFVPHEELSPAEIARMVAVHLTAPMILANQCLRDLKENQGHLVHLCSIEAVRSSKWSALYSGTKAGLRQFSLSLYEEVRKAGVKVTCIHPDLVRTPFFDRLNFEPAQGDEYALDPHELANTILHVLQNPGVITELTIRPVKLGIAKKRGGRRAADDLAQ